MKSPLKSLCCFSKPKEIDPDHAGEDEGQVNAVQPTSNTPEKVAASPVVVPTIVSPVVKGHKRTPSEVSVPTSPATPAAPTSPLTVAAQPPTTPTAPKVSRSSSSTSSYQSSASVQTAIERPGLVREASKESVITTIERTPSPAASKKGDGVSTVTSPDAKSSQQSAKRGMSEDLPAPTTPSKEEDEETKSPKKEDGGSNASSPAAKSPHESPKREMSGSPAPSTPEKPELPKDVDTLDKVDKLNEIIDGEKYDIKHPFFDKISLHYGDITKIQVDAIVNAANERLGGGGGVDGAIHRAAGHNQLQAECRKHDRPVATGDAVVTDACKLSTHVKKIIHCVGPICYSGVTNERRNKLLSCYRRAIQLSEENGLRSIAFCCISTGIYGYDNNDAAKTVIKFLWKHFSKEENVAKWDRVVLCLFMDIDKKCYQRYIRELVLDPTYFDDDEESEDEEDEKKKKEEEEEEEDDDKDEEEKEDDEKEKKKEEKEKEKDDTGVKTDKSENSQPKEQEKGEKSTVEGVDSKKEEGETSANSTSAAEEMEVEEGKEQEGEKGEGEKENNEVDGRESGDGVTNKKRPLSEEKEEEPPLKREKMERESAV